MPSGSPRPFATPPEDATPLGTRLFRLAATRHGSWRAFEIAVEGRRSTRGRRGSWVPSRAALNRWLKEANLRSDGLMWLAHWFSVSIDFLVFGEPAEEDYADRPLSDGRLRHELGRWLVRTVYMDPELIRQVGGIHLDPALLCWAMPADPLKALGALFHGAYLEEVNRLEKKRLMPARQREVRRWIEEAAAGR